MFFVETGPFVQVCNERHLASDPLTTSKGANQYLETRNHGEKHLFVNVMSQLELGVFSEFNLATITRIKINIGTIRRQAFTPMDVISQDQWLWSRISLSSKVWLIFYATLSTEGNPSWGDPPPRSPSLIVVRMTSSSSCCGYQWERWFLY